jgi:hypothetical protein
LLSLFFDPEGGGDISLRNFGWLSTDYTALYPRGYNGSCISMLFSLLPLGIPNGLQTKLLHAFLISFTCATYPGLIVRLHFITSSNIYWTVKFMKLQTVIFSIILQ